MTSWLRSKPSKLSVTRSLLKIAQAKRNKENADDKIAAMQTLSAEVKSLDAELAEIDAKLTEFTTTLPNIPADSVPIG